ncbi:MAG: hypothetical protein ACRDPY_08660 [Streptosporangiaceae bacterium]
MTPADAIGAAELAEAETRYRNQLAREMYEAGWRGGYEAARDDVEAEEARRWADFTRRLANAPTHAELEERRWGPGGRGRLTGPRPGCREPEPELEAG